MGLIFSRFYEKTSTRDTLERIEQELQNIEERRWDKIKREQFVVQILSFIPITILVATFCILIYPSDSSFRDKLLLCVPIVILNLFLWLCRKCVQWYSRWSLDNEDARLRKLQKEKKKILEIVCETESYKVASELLEKYDPKQLKRRERPQSRPSSPTNTSLTKFSASPLRSPAQQQLHNTTQTFLPNHTSFLNQSLSFPVPAPQVPIAPAAPPPTPVTKTSRTNTNVTSPLNTSIVTSPVIAASSVQGRPVRPILSKERTLFERMVDWVVADGPDNRFALICRYCYGHNGMSLAEEFETINFRCCYCYNLNTASNKRHQVHDQLQTEREKPESDNEVANDTEKASSSDKDRENVQASDPKVEMLKEGVQEEVMKEVEEEKSHDECVSKEDKQ